MLQDLELRTSSSRTSSEILFLSRLQKMKQNCFPNLETLESVSRARVSAKQQQQRERERGKWGKGNPGSEFSVLSRPLRGKERERTRIKEISYPVPQEQPPSQHPSPPAQQAPPTASFLEHAHFSQPHFSPQAVQQHLQSAVFLVSFAWSRKRERSEFFFFFSWSVSLNAQRPRKTTTHRSSRRRKRTWGRIRSRPWSLWLVGGRSLSGRQGE